MTLCEGGLRGERMKGASVIELIADSREARSGIAERIGSMPGYSVRVEQLEVGDFIPGPGVVVERKRGPDWAASILDGRFIPQIKLMKATYGRAIVLIEGSVTDTFSRIELNALMGAKSWVAALQEVPMLHTANEEESAALLAIMARHLQEGLGYDEPLRSNKPKDNGVIAQYIVEGLPGVGPGKAKGLLAAFGSASGVFGASVQALAAVKGIGPKTAERIREALDARVGG